MWIGKGGFQGPLSWEGLDLKTGELKDRLENRWKDVLKGKCSSDMITKRFILFSGSFIDRKDGGKITNTAMRGGCGYPSSLLANGLVYNFPHECCCVPFLRGLLVLAGKEEGSAEAKAGAGEEEDRLVKGPAYGKVVPQAQAPVESGWPIWRRKSSRS